MRLYWSKKVLYKQRDQQNSTFRRGFRPSASGVCSLALPVVFDNADPAMVKSATDRPSSAEDKGKTGTHTSSFSSDGLIGSQKLHLENTGPDQNHLLGDITALAGDAG